MNPDEAVDMALLADVPAWLRSLRLHKYTPNFEKANWKEMIMLDDAGLDAKGVNALGARRKLLKSVSDSFTSHPHTLLLPACTFVDVY